MTDSPSVPGRRTAKQASHHLYPIEVDMLCDAGDLRFTLFLMWLDLFVAVMATFARPSRVLARILVEYVLTALVATVLALSAYAAGHPGVDG